MIFIVTGINRNWIVNNIVPIQGRIQSNVVGGGVPKLLGGVRARRREAPSSKCDRGSAKRLPKELRQGSGGAK